MHLGLLNMGLGFGKDFILFLIISVVIGLVYENWQSGVGVMITYILCKVIWNILT